jgi:hypothetical protein
MPRREPTVTRPRLPQGYVDNPIRILAWDEVERKLAEARHYWVCSVRPNGRPHSIPKWGVWVDGRLYFDGSPLTRHSRNIAANPFVSIHLESGESAVIMEGTAREVRPTRELAVSVAREYAAKYAAAGYSPAPTQWDAGGLYEVTPSAVIAWTVFFEDPTKFVFPSEAD